MALLFISVFRKFNDHKILRFSLWCFGHKKFKNSKKKKKCLLMCFESIFFNKKIIYIYLLNYLLMYLTWEHKTKSLTNMTKIGGVWQSFLRVFFSSSFLTSFEKKGKKSWQTSPRVSPNPHSFILLLPPIKKNKFYFSSFCQLICSFLFKELSIVSLNFSLKLRN